MQSMPRLNTRMDSPTTPELQQSSKWTHDDANTSAPELMNSPSSMYSVNSPVTPISPTTPSRVPFVNEKRSNVDTPLLRTFTHQDKQTLSLPTPTVSRQSSTRRSQSTLGSLTVGRQIGSGTFSKIFEAYGPQGIFAIKTRISSTPKEIFASEMSVLSKLRQNGGSEMPVVQFYPELSDEDHCVLEMFQTSLDSLVKSPKFRPDENSIDFFDYRLMIQPICGLKTWCLWAQKLVKGLKFIHAHNVVHADLKPDNVLVNNALGGDAVLAISDFSAAVDLDAQPGSVLPSELPNHFALSPVFSDPELRHGTKLPSFGSDIYALGLVLAFCATGQEPYSSAKNATQRLLWMDKMGPLDSFDMDVTQRLKLVRPVIELLLQRRWDGVDEALEALLASA